MTSTIRETVMQHVPAGYENYARNAITALAARESQLVDELVRVAQGQGLNPTTVRRQLEEIGFTVPILVTTSGGGVASTPAPGVDRDTLRRVGQQLASGITNAVNQAVADAQRALNL